MSDAERDLIRLAGRNACVPRLLRTRHVIGMNGADPKAILGGFRRRAREFGELLVVIVEITIGPRGPDVLRQGIRDKPEIRFAKPPRFRYLA